MTDYLAKVICVYFRRSCTEIQDGYRVQEAGLSHGKWVKHFFILIYFPS